MTKLSYNVVTRTAVYTGIKSYPDACFTARNTGGKIISVYEPCEIKDIVKVRTDRIVARV